MICGTMVFEDTVLQWQLHPGDGVTYTVCDNLSGETETKGCSWEGFAAATALAIAGDEIVCATQLYAVAEPAMPENANLRWIP